MSQYEKLRTLLVDLKAQLEAQARTELKVLLVECPK